MIKKAITETKSKGEVKGYRLNIPKDSNFKKDDLAIILTEEEYENLKEDKEKIENDLTELENIKVEYNKLKTKHESVIEDNEKQKEEIEKLNQHINEYDSKYKDLDKKHDSLKDNNETLKEEINKLNQKSKEDIVNEIAQITEDYIKSINENNESHEKKIVEYERKLTIAIAALKHIEDLSFIDVLRRKYKREAKENLKLIETPEEIEL